MKTTILKYSVAITQQPQGAQLTGKTGRNCVSVDFFAAQALCTALFRQVHSVFTET
jgi:hypothetical protein